MNSIGYELNTTSPKRDWDDEKFKADPEAWFRKYVIHGFFRITIIIRYRCYDWRVKQSERQPFDPEIHCKPLSYDEKMGGNPPRMPKTIFLTSPDHWSLGCLMTCEKIEVGNDVPSDAVCQCRYRARNSLPISDCGILYLKQLLTTPLPRG